jgi:DNA-binding MarR family transcriptional regulator
MTTALSGMLQVKAYRVLRQHVNEVLVNYDLSLTEWAILCNVHENKKMKLAEIAMFLEVESPLVTNLIDQLLKKKFVIRKNDKNDKRAKIVSLSKNAITKLPEIEENLRKKMETLLSGISEVELETYFRVLSAITAQS